MNILVVGAGAIGLLFGGYLQASGHKLTFLTRTQQQSEIIRQRGVLVKQLDDSPYTYSPTVVSFAQKELIDSKQIDLLLVCLKQTSLAQVLPFMKTWKERKPELPILFLMNGMSHVEQAASWRQVYLAVTQHGATKITEHEVLEKGQGLTIIGGNTGGNAQPHPLIRQLITSLQELKLHVRWEEEIEIALWKKCIVNACINPLTAIYGVTNGELLTDALLFQLLERLYVEAALLVQQKGEDFAKKVVESGKLWRDIQGICRNTSENLSSMLQDVQAKRTTELEAITGFLLNQAKNYALTLLAHQFVYGAILQMEKEYAHMS